MLAYLIVRTLVDIILVSLTAIREGPAAVLALIVELYASSTDPTEAPKSPPAEKARQCVFIRRRTEVDRSSNKIRKHTVGIQHSERLTSNHLLRIQSFKKCQIGLAQGRLGTRADGEEKGGRHVGWCGLWVTTRSHTTGGCCSKWTIVSNELYVCLLSLYILIIYI